jgi:Protein of unknown function (DUF2905)
MNRRATLECGNRGLYDGCMGRTLIAIGIALVVLGILVTFGEKLPIRLGRLPGDIAIRGKNTTFYFPLATSLLLSVLLSLAMWLIGRR